MNKINMEVSFQLLLPTVLF